MLCAKIIEIGSSLLKDIQD